MPTAKADQSASNHSLINSFFQTAIKLLAVSDYLSSQVVYQLNPI